MSKVQFWVLNFVGGVCAVLIIANIFLTRSNDNFSQVLMGRQNDFNRAQQVDSTIRSLIMRIAQAGKSDHSLSNLLVRHDIKVTPPAENPSKPAP